MLVIIPIGICVIRTHLFRENLYDVNEGCPKSLATLPILHLIDE
jgi:hypothetical protein